MNLEWIDIEKKPKLLTKKRVVFFAVALGCLLLCGVLQLVRTHIVSSLQDTRAAERFAPEGGYAQVSCYFAEGADVSADRYREFLYRIETALTAGAIGTESDNPDARLFLACYSTEGKVKLSNGTKEAEASATGTGGDFFFIHTPALVSGMYYRADALSQDQILIDETLAWQLFGSSDVAGQAVEIDGAPFYISGVCKTGDGRLDKAAGAAGAMVYLPAEALDTYGTVYGTAHTMNCFEVVMPNPVRDFAASTLRRELDVDETKRSIVDQNVRFGNFALFKVLTAFGTRSMAGAAMRFPYWENVARGTEDMLVIVMVLQALLLVVPVLIVTVMTVQAYRHKKWTAKGVFDGIADRIYERRAVRM